MKVQVLAGARINVANTAPAIATPRKAGDACCQRRQFVGQLANRWAANTMMANVQKVTGGTGQPSPPAGTNSRWNTASAVANVGERNNTNASVTAVKVIAMRSAVPGPVLRTARKAVRSRTAQRKAR